MVVVLLLPRQARKNADKFPSKPAAAAVSTVQATDEPPLLEDFSVATVYNHLMQQSGLVTDLLKDHYEALGAKMETVVARATQMREMVESIKLPEPQERPNSSLVRNRTSGRRQAEVDLLQAAASLLRATPRTADAPPLVCGVGSEAVSGGVQPEQTLTPPTAAGLVTAALAGAVEATSSHCGDLSSAARDAIRQLDLEVLLEAGNHEDSGYIGLAEVLEQLPDVRLPSDDQQRLAKEIMLARSIPDAENGDVFLEALLCAETTSSNIELELQQSKAEELATLMAQQARQHDLANRVR
jgi:hypothetical protein